MNVPVNSTLPKSTLAPLALEHKFRTAGAKLSVGFAGLGDCLNYDWESGMCLDSVLGGSGDGGGDSLWFYGVPVTGSGESSTTNWNPPFLDPSGNIVLASPNGGYTTIDPNGNSSSHSGTPPAPSSGTISASQAARYAQLISTLATAGVRIAAATNLPAGATILPNGTIVGSGASLTDSGVNAQLANILSNPVLILATLVGVLIVVEAGK